MPSDSLDCPEEQTWSHMIYPNKSLRDSDSYSMSYWSDMMMMMQAFYPIAAQLSYESWAAIG